MGEAKKIIVKPISSHDANSIVKAIHYSGKVVNNSQLHLGVFLNGKCGGAMQFGPSLDKRKIQGLVKGTLWNEFIELNRMAFADWLPRNSESRALGYAFRWIKKTYPQIKWIISFADGTQCGDGTIYRASGFSLTGIKINNQIWEAPAEGGHQQVFSRMSLTDGKSKGEQKRAKSIVSRTTVTKGGHINDDGAASMLRYKNAGWKPKNGFQLRYIYFIDSSCIGNLTVPIVPFSEIEKRGAAMYKGVSKNSARSIDSDALAAQAGEGGANPTRVLTKKP